MALQFPLNPVVGQVYTDPTGNVSFQWNGVQWVSTKALPVASDTDMLAGTADFIFATPKKLKLGFDILLAQNGYFKFPNWMGGLILQWAQETSVNSPVTINWPMEFPTAVLNAQLTVKSASYSVDSWPAITNLSTTSISIYTPISVSHTKYVFAIGH